MTLYNKVETSGAINSCSKVVVVCLHYKNTHTNWQKATEAALSMASGCDGCICPVKRLSPITIVACNPYQW